MAKNYVKGLRTFPPRENAPAFVKGTLIITPDELVEWCNANPQFLTDYQGKKQIKLQILEGDKGINFPVDEYKPKGDNF